MSKKKENQFYQKLNTVSDWILRIILINFLMIICSLPIVTLYPAIVAGYKMYTNYLDKREVPIFKGYFEAFKENFGDKMSMGLFLAFGLFLGILNLTIYSDYLEINPNVFSVIGYYVMIILIILIAFVSVFTLPLMVVYPKTSFSLMLKFAFFLSGKYIFRTILAILIALIPIVMFLTPITMVLFFFVGLSAPTVLYALLLKPVKQFIISIAEEKE